MENGFMSLAGYAPFVTIGLVILTNVVIAFGLGCDASRLRTRGIGLFLFWPIGWFILGLASGFIALAAYWIAHYSTFRSSAAE